MPQTHQLASSASDISRQRLIGIGLMCCAYMCFTMLDTTAKWLNHSIPTPQTVWARYVCSVFIIAAFINPRSHPGVLRTRRPVLQVIRSILLFGSTLMNFIAVNYLQLSQTMTIALATPLLVALFSGPILGETVGKGRMTAIIIGFFGVILVARPGYGGIHPVALLSVIGVCCYAAFALMTRHLAAYDSTETTLVYSGLIGAVILSFGVPFFWQDPPSTLVWCMMAATGLFGAVGHFCLILAHRHAPANVLAPFMYTQLLWMTLSGFVVFGDVPDGFTVAGGLVVAASGLYVLTLERKRQGMIPAVAN